MEPSAAESFVDLSLAGSLLRVTDSAVSIEHEVLTLFDRCAPSLCRYIASFGLSIEESEDLVQDAFLQLFEHLRRGRSRENLRGWLFQVAHNQALKRRGRLRHDSARTWDEEAAARHVDPAPTPETRLVEHERRRLLTSVVRALPARDRRCLALRAKGLRYREIAAALGVSLGTVAKSMTRAITRLTNADER